MQPSSGTGGPPERYASIGSPFGTLSFSETMVKQMMAQLEGKDAQVVDVVPVLSNATHGGNWVKQKKSPGHIRLIAPQEVCEQIGAGQNGKMCVMNVEFVDPSGYELINTQQ